jgi:hypothetical protein
MLQRESEKTMEGVCWRESKRHMGLEMGVNGLWVMLHQLPTCKRKNNANLIKKLSCHQSINHIQTNLTEIVGSTNSTRF